MPASHGRHYGRHCRRCRVRISRRTRRCPVCRALNLKPVDYLLIPALLAGVAALAWRLLL